MAKTEPPPSWGQMGLENATEYLHHTDANDRHVTMTGHWLHCEDMTTMMARAIRAHIWHPKPDVTLNIETHLFNVAICAEDAGKFNLDVGKDLWLNKQRWSRLIKEYVPKDALDRFLPQCAEILNGAARDGATANMMFRDPDRYAKKHRWGGCLMGATFRGDGHKAGKPTLTFYSRTTYIGYMGLLDAAIAHVMARVIMSLYVPRSNRVTPTIGFRWHISSSQLHCFKTLPYIYSQPDLMKHIEKVERNRGLLIRQTPTWHHLCKWYFKVCDHWDASGHDTEKFLNSEKYGPFRRIKRRWLEHQRHLAKHVPPSLMASELDFERAISDPGAITGPLPSDNDDDFDFDEEN